MSSLNVFVLRGLLRMFLLIVTGIHTCTNGFSIGTSVDKAQTCSNFDFQEKLLEKMVRLEHSVELERKLKKFEDMLSEKVSKMENTNSEKMKEMEHHINAKLELLDEEDVKRRDAFQSQRDKLDEELRHQKDASVEVIQNVTVKSEDLVNKIMDKHNNLLKAFDKNLKNKNNHFEESVEEMNATLKMLLSTTEKETENQQKLFTEIVNDAKLNTSLLNQKILDHQNKNDEKLRLFVETESSQNKASLTVCAEYKGYNRGEPIIFPYVHTRNSISNHVISSLKTTGIFTCEKPGLYLISLFVMTSKHEGRIYLFKNDGTITYMFYSLNGAYQTNSATVLEYLSINDRLTVKTDRTMYVWNNNKSCITVLQLTH